MMSTNIFISILRELHVSFTKSFTLRAYEEHPYKYTFFGLKSLCERYGIEAKGLFLCDKRSILNLSLPFVAYFNNDYALVKKIDGERIVFEMYGSDNQLLLTDFINDCSGHVLIFKSNEKSIEPNYKQHLFNKWFSYVEYLCLAISAAVLLSIFMAGRPIPTCIEFILMLLSLLGCFLSGMLITQQMKVHNSLAESVCHVFKESSCNNVLESSAAKFLGRYSWAEIGFSYFFVNLIGLMILSNSQESLAYVAALSLLYSIWSVWYQYRMSQWCPICLMVQGVVFMQFLCYLLGGFYSQVIKWDVQVIGCFIAAYICCTLMIHKLLPFFIYSSQLQQTQWEYNHLKMNEKVFNLLLHEETEYEVADSTIEFGNNSSNMVITIFSNPYCNPCAAMHKRLQDLYASNSCLIRYVFTSFKPEWNIINKFLIAVYQQYGAEKAWEAYTEWYDKGKFSREHFFDKYHLDMNSEDIEDEFQRHEQWQKNTKLNATPIVLVNGYKMPYGYTIEEMPYIA